MIELTYLFVELTAMSANSIKKIIAKAAAYAHRKVNAFGEEVAIFMTAPQVKICHTAVSATISRAKN